MSDDQQMLIDHERTWNGFKILTKWSSILVVLILASLALFVY